jgi:hypothetical protein
MMGRSIAPLPDPSAIGEIMTAKPSKIAQYLAEGDRLRDAVDAYRAARSDVTPVSPSEPTPAPTKRRSYPLPPAQYPSELPDYPLNWGAARQDGEAIIGPAKEIPDYGSLGRLKAVRAAQAERRGKKSPLTPSGPSRLVKAREASIDPSRIERGSK